MEIKVKLAYGTFMFLEDLSINRNSGFVDIDLSKKSDSFINTIAISIACGKLVSNVSHEKILELIQDEHTKLNTKKTLGTTISDNDFADVEEVAVEVIEIKEDKAEDKAVDEVVKVQEDEKIVVQEDFDIPALVNPLSVLLQGSNKSVLNKIKKADLSDEDKENVIKLEKEGKNRRAVVSMLQV